MMKNTLLLFVFILMVNMSFAQLDLHTDNFANKTDATEFDCTSVENIGIKVPIDESFLKYDQVKVILTYKNDDGNFETDHGYRYQGVVQQFLPNSKTFEDNYAGENEIEVYFFAKKGERHYCHVDKNIRDYRIAVAGYFENGMESYYNENTSSFKTKTVYTFSKNIHYSKEFKFKLDDSKVEIAKNVEKVYDTNSDIYDIYTKTTTIPVVGDVQANISIYNAYQVFYKALDKSEYDRVIVVQEKLIAIQNNKLKALNKALKNETNVKEIETLILNF